MQLGEEWNLKSHVLKQLEDFTCLMYGQNRESAKLLCKIVGDFPSIRQSEATTVIHS